MKWSVGTKIGAGYCLGLAILVVIGITSYQSTSKFIDNSESTIHTYKVLTILENVLSLLKDAETGQRGFIITGKDSYLDPYQNVSLKIHGEIEELKKLTSDNLNQQRRLDKLDPLIKNKLAELQETIELRRGQGFEPAREVVITDKGKQFMDDIRNLLGEMESEENDLLKLRRDSALASAKNSTAIIVFGIPLSILLLALAGFNISRNITIPLKEVSGAAAKIAAGELAIGLTATNRMDEVGAMKNIFNNMIITLQEMARVAEQIAAGNLAVGIKPQSNNDQLGNSLLTMIANLRRMMGEILEGINVLSSTASEILAITTQVSVGATETSTAVTEITATVQEVKQTAQVSVQKAKNVSDSAQKVAQVSVSGKKSVEQSINGMHQIRQQMASIATSIVRLSEQNQAIGEIIATVNDLAEQSNLLAVNAAIEAARAGENGRGFAVVAHEVRNLAEQSKQATTQVRTILSDIQKATSTAVMATEQGTKAVELGVKQSADAGESIKILSDSIDEAAQAALQISASSQQQLIGMDQVAQAMENIKQASLQNVASTKQAEIAAQDINGLGRKLQQMVERYRL
jgi:methyl-accepting chemotaxis protein